MRKAGTNYQIKETIFKRLMANRVGDILLICSDYDKFMLEEDGRIDEMLFQEYVSLNLRYPPQFTHVTSTEEAFKLLAQRNFDVVIIMLGLGGKRAEAVARRIKKAHPGKPVLVLTPLKARDEFPIVCDDCVTTVDEPLGDLSESPPTSGSSPGSGPGPAPAPAPTLTHHPNSAIDYVFTWQGNSNIFLAMVKLVEDRMNLDYDVSVAGVQTIILVEDSVRYYSSYLPIMYLAIFKQSRLLMIEGLNEWQQTMRLRCRPKVILARNYEEALWYYEKYKNQLLGIITDVAYKRNGVDDREAGLQLCAHIRAENKDLPIVLQSSNLDNEAAASQFNATFIHKHSEALLKQLGDLIRNKYGFGDFVFRDPVTMEPIARAKDLRELQHRIADVPTDSFVHHTSNNDISKWLKARALFSLAQYVHPIQAKDFSSVLAFREFLIGVIKEHRRQEGRGTITEFNRERYDEYTYFARIGAGSMGGKGRGLAFVDTHLKRFANLFQFPGVIISIPRSVVIGTDIFEHFMESNNLVESALRSNQSDQDILAHFLRARFPDHITQDLAVLLVSMNHPVAVRSSSLLEDSHFQPFAGIYKTYMLPNNNADFDVRLNELLQAIKAVYASTYYRRSKDYMQATGNMIEEERMAVIVQEVTGNVYNGRCYPNISGVARSLNYYPIENEKPEDGVVNVALGLGQTVVEGGRSLRFCSRYPKKIMQLSDVDTALRSTQQEFFALRMQDTVFNPTASLEGVDGTSHVVSLEVQEAEQDGSLPLVASTYDFQNHRIRDGVVDSGKRVITFAGVLKHNMFPLAPILNTLMDMGSQAMRMPIEIEFAVNLDTPAGQPKKFSLLQIRPIVAGLEHEQIDIDDSFPEGTVVFSNKALGNGFYQDIRDFVYVKPEAFDPAETREMANMIGDLNRRFEEDGKGYILLVPGRLGSVDPWLGIPIAWSQITRARVIIELGLEHFQVEPSQGSHFFQNLTTLQNAYLTINPYLGDGIFKQDLLDGREAVFENKYLRHVAFDVPFVIKIDGRTGRALIYQEEGNKGEVES